MKTIAILLTCHNRKDKTITCLNSLYTAINEVPKCKFDIFLVDDGSTDGTGNEIRSRFPNIKVIDGDGNLFWAGGMRLAWKSAITAQEYDAYLLLNDDVQLNKSFILNILETHEHSLKKTGKSGIYCGATADIETGKISYGGLKIVRNDIILRTSLINPADKPLKCDFANANILWVSKDVVNQIGTLSDKFVHCLADYDYTLTANEHKIPIWIVPGVSGFCSNDHGNSWKPITTSLKERIAYLKSPKGLAYEEYLYYVRKHFPLFYPYSFCMLWLKTFFPFVWDNFKKA
jgi:Predicted glycosyltransferases